jgi:mono/diheme cytochrome c family protein
MGIPAPHLFLFRLRSSKSLGCGSATMKLNLPLFPTVAIALSAGALLQPGCTHSPDPAPGPPAFAKARVVLETNCVHCHNENRIVGMPPIATSHSLAKLIGPGNWIVPGQPDQSRFFQVVTFADEIPGAMPPTGHAISREEVQILRDWIQRGAPMPEGPSLHFQPRGENPRSR